LEKAATAAKPTPLAPLRMLVAGRLNTRPSRGNCYGRLETTRRSETVPTRVAGQSFRRADDNQEEMIGAAREATEAPKWSSTISRKSRISTAVALALRRDLVKPGEMIRRCFRF